jgi:hypothetical protein
MDKPDLPIRGKVTLQSLSRSDERGIRLDVTYYRHWTLDLQDFADEVQIELFRPPSQSENRLRILRQLSRGDIELLLAGITKLTRLVLRRRHMEERPPEQGVEFSIRVFDDMLIAVRDCREKASAYFLELSKGDDAIRFEFESAEGLELLRHLLESAR